MVNNLDFLCHNLWCSVGVVDGLPRAGSHYNLGTSRGPDKIGSRAGPGPRAASCTWLVYTVTTLIHHLLNVFVNTRPKHCCSRSALTFILTKMTCVQSFENVQFHLLWDHYSCSFQNQPVLKSHFISVIPLWLYTR